MIELQNIYKKYHNTSVLKNINIFIQEGELFGLIGKSGSGKSTVLRMINRLESADQGEVIINNISIRHINKQQLQSVRYQVAMVFQHFNLLQSKTVFENIALPLRIQKASSNYIKEKVSSLLTFVDLAEKSEHYPSQLSGGQKQRVAIARALSTSPRILLCDEATSALDPETTQSILTLLKRINHEYGITMVIVTHEMDVVKRICHRVALLEDGELIEEIALSSIFDAPTSKTAMMLFTQLSPQLPPCLQAVMVEKPNSHPLLRILFHGVTTTTPFISTISRELNINITILLANIDRFDGLTCGVLIVELQANHELLAAFIHRCRIEKLNVEVLGYVVDNVL